MGVRALRINMQLWQEMEPVICQIFWRATPFQFPLLSFGFRSVALENDVGIGFDMFGRICQVTW